MILEDAIVVSAEAMLFIATLGTAMSHHVPPARESLVTAIALAMIAFVNWRLRVRFGAIVCAAMVALWLCMFLEGLT